MRKVANIMKFLCLPKDSHGEDHGPEPVKTLIVHVEKQQKDIDSQENCLLEGLVHKATVLKEGNQAWKNAKYLWDFNLDNVQPSKWFGYEL